jgi:hypothetical protein
MMKEPGITTVVRAVLAGEGDLPSNAVVLLFEFLVDCSQLRSQLRW